MTEQSRGEGSLGSEEKHVFTPSWVMEKEDEYNEYHPQIQLIARQLHQMPSAMMTSDYLRDIYLKLQGEVIGQRIPETHAVPLMAKIGVKHEELVKAEELLREEKKPVESEQRDVLVEAIKDLSRIKDLRKLLEKAGQLGLNLTEEQIKHMNVSDVVNSYSGQTEVLRKAFGRLLPQEEKARWVDVEYDQEFYTRFAPNQEPYFYTELSSNERKEWDARWRLARAAFYKKIYSAMPEKLVENQDLIELTTEQMELLYGIDGVREALEWYVRTIVGGKETVVNKKRVEICFFDCVSGADFELFREKLRGYLRKKVMPELTKKDLEELDKEGKGLTEEEKNKALEIKIKSADAIAWNFIFCSNLVESIDSRDSYSGERHILPPVLCSDGLRAVFHPQEKFESKCVGDQEWGAFGKWGKAQLERIKMKYKDNKGTVEAIKKRLNKGLPADEKVKWRVEYNYKFVEALSPTQFWTDEGMKEYKTEKKNVDGEVVERKLVREVTVFVPECYPITSMESFLEESKIFDQIKGGREVDWSRVDADPWKTSYLTIKLRKAIGLFEYFMGKVPFEEEKDKEWTGGILDIYTRLDLERRMGKDAFHNLKSWVFRASLGGVSRPESQGLSSPIDPASFGAFAMRLRGQRLRYLKHGFLGGWFGEGLEIRKLRKNRL